MFPFYFILLLISALVAAQDGGVTYYRDGNFTYPNKFGMTYAAGSSITVTWKTEYTRSNLYYSQYEDDANSVLITANTDSTSWTWTVATSKTNLTLPFHFHVVNAGGDTNAQYYGGIWSPGFYITDSTKSASSSSSSSTPSPTTTPSALTTSLPPSSVPASATAAATPPAPTQPPTETTSPAITPGAITGIVFGALAGAALLLAAVLFYQRRRGRSRRAEGEKPGIGGPSEWYSTTPEEIWPPPGTVNVKPVELAAKAEVVAELEGSGRGR